MTNKNESDEKIQTQAEEVEIEYLTEKKTPPKRTSRTSSAKLSAQKEQIRKLEAEVDGLKQESEKLREDFLRIAADKENLRKRLEREKNDYFQFAFAELLRDFLNVLDNFERALDVETKPEGDAFREGIAMIYRQYLDTLKKQGVAPIETENEKFDPTVQQAFITEESNEVTEPTVGEVLQRGYRLHERLLRPALVKVLVPRKTGD